MFVSRIENDTAESRRGSNEREGRNVRRGNNRQPVCISRENKFATNSGYRRFERAIRRKLTRDYKSQISSTLCIAS